MLVGRDRELQQLEAALERVAGSSGGLFLFAGEPGIGKTRLATEVVERARARGVRATWGRCWEAGGAPTLWPWREACEGLALTFPDPAALAAGDPAEARFAFHREVTRVLASVPPCVLVLEDLHAADRSSLLLLEAVAVQLRTLPVLLVGTYRDLEASLVEETRGALVRAGRNGTVMPLARLGEAEVAALVHDAIADADVRLTANIYQTTLGNPLFVDELVRDVRAGHGARVPLGVREVIRQRIGLVTPEVRDVLEAAAVLGVELDVADLERIDGRAVAVLDAALRSGLVELRGARVRFSHALYREALYHDLATARRRALHRDAARALAARAAPISEIAHHLLESGDAPVAIDHAIRGAYEALAELSFEDATALLERARAAIPTDAPALRCRVMIALGEVQIRRGDAGGRARCVEAAQVARELGDPELLALAGLAYGSVLVMGGVDATLVGILEDALARLPADAPLRARTMARLAAARQPSAPTERARDIQLAFDAIELARRVAEPRELLEVLHAASGVMYGAVAPSIRMPISREQERLAEELGDNTRLLHARTRLAIDHLEMASFQAHAQLATSYEELATRIGPAAAPWRVPLMRSLHAMLGGELATSERLQAEARGLEHGQPRARRAIAFHRICFLRAAERHAELRAAIPELRDLWLQMEYGKFMVEPRVASTLARIGADDEARALLDALPRSAYEEEINAVSLAEALWLTGDRSHVREVQKHLRVDRWAMYWFDCEIVEGPNARLAAYLAALAGDWEDCDRLFAGALREAEGAGLRLLPARMRFELGDLLLRLDRDHERARSLIAEGRAAAEQLGLDELVALIDRRHGAVSAPIHAPPLALSLEGEYYALATHRGPLRFKASRGMQYLARLMAEPRAEIHVLELCGSSDHADRGDAGELVDASALRTYRSRLLALRDALEDAEAIGDSERAERARAEMEAIAAEVTRGSALGGRARRSASAVERARSAVQRRIKDALDRISEQAPDVGKHLRRSVRTGNYCSYRPDD